MPVHLRFSSQQHFWDFCMEHIAAFYLVCSMLPHILMIIIFSALCIKQLVFFNAVSLCVYCVLLFIQLRRPALAMMLGQLEVCAFSAATTVFCGWRAGFFLYTIGMLSASYLLNSFFHSRLGSISRTANLLTLVLLIIFNERFSPHLCGWNDASLDSFYPYLFAMNLFLCAFIVFLSVQLFNHSLMRYSQKLEESNRRLEYMASHDPLTGLRNRWSAKGLLEQCHTQAIQKDVFYCMAMADIDDFKQFNDQYGHSFGDRILTDLANSITAIVQNRGYAFRWGGEEIMILFPNTKKPAAKQILSDIQRRLETICQKYYEDCRQVTLTLGLAEYRPGLTIDAMISLADKRLYIGKAQGKNRIIDSD